MGVNHSGQLMTGELRSCQDTVQTFQRSVFSPLLSGLSTGALHALGV